VQSSPRCLVACAVILVVGRCSLIGRELGSGDEPPEQAVRKAATQPSAWIFPRTVIHSISNPANPAGFRTAGSAYLRAWRGFKRPVLWPLRPLVWPFALCAMRSILFVDGLARGTAQREYYRIAARSFTGSVAPPVSRGAPRQCVGRHVYSFHGPAEAGHFVAPSWFMAAVKSTLRLAAVPRAVLNSRAWRAPRGPHVSARALDRVGASLQFLGDDQTVKVLVVARIPAAVRIALRAPALTEFFQRAHRAIPGGGSDDEARAGRRPEDGAAREVASRRTTPTSRPSGRPRTRRRGGG
jgi:hypothetical protein